MEAHDYDYDFDPWRRTRLTRLIHDDRYFTQNLRLVEVYASWMVPNGLTLEDFWPWMHKHIAEFEDHERDEFFKVGGFAIYDPHQEGYAQQIKAVKHQADCFEQRLKAGAL